MDQSASIIVCTRNRAQMLQGLLETTRELIVPTAVSCELIVVDNGSTDSTANVAQAWKSGSLNVRYVSAPLPGKGHAYNAGLAIAQGAICLFTDDDVRPCPEWLLHHLDPYTDPQVAAVQGRIVLEFDQPPPDWFDTIHRASLVETDKGETPIFPYEVHLIGANMSFRKQVVDTVGNFNPLLGPGKSGFWDDSEFSQRLMNAGFLQYYQPRAIVRHLVSTARLSPEYYRDVMFRNGVSAYMAQQIGTCPRDLHPYRRFIRASLHYMKVRTIGKMSRSWPVCSQEELLYCFARGVFWANLQGMSRLTEKYR